MAYSIYHLHRAVSDFPQHNKLFYLGAIIPESYVVPNSGLVRDDFHLLSPLTTLPSDDLLYANRKLLSKYKWNFSNLYQLSYYLGYSHHLILDAIWVYKIYKPFFSINGQFPQGFLYHDVFRIYVDTLAKKTYQNTDIIDDLQNSDIKTIGEFINSNVANLWKNAVCQQLHAMPNTTTTLSLFIGDQSRFTEAKEKYQQTINEVKKTITPTHITEVENLTTKLFSIFYQQYQNPQDKISITNLS